MKNTPGLLTENYSAALSEYLKIQMKIVVKTTKGNATKISFKNQGAII